MPDLNYTIQSVKTVRNSATPLVGFRVHVIDTSAALSRIHSIILNTQIRIEPARRRYDDFEQDRLLPLFDSQERWGKTLRNLLWTNSIMVVPPFTGETLVEMQVPCSFDFSLAATRYFDSLQSGDIPISFLFSGTIFHEDTEGRGLQVAQIPWDREARYKLPVAVWKELMASFYPNSAWLNLRKDLFDSLQRYAAANGLPSCEAALSELLTLAGRQCPEYAVAARTQ